jgi:hypothetical protein
MTRRRADGRNVGDPGPSPRAQWRAAPLRARIYVACVVTCAAAVTAHSVPAVAAHRRSVVLFLLFAVGSVVNIELGRWLEGGRLEQDRTHKGMSA